MLTAKGYVCVRVCSPPPNLAMNAMKEILVSNSHFFTFMRLDPNNYALCAACPLDALDSHGLIPEVLDTQMIVISS